MQLSEDEWKKKLTPEQYKILREKGTEIPFSGDHLKPSREGVYSCVACGSELFHTKTQYDSSFIGLQGWPSFGDVAKSDAVELIDDHDYGMQRVEVVCKKCGGHLGHLFEDDDDSPTGKHYCINSACLAFQPEEGASHE